jgi:hypothetical protein
MGYADDRKTGSDERGGAADCSRSHDHQTACSSGQAARPSAVRGDADGDLADAVCSQSVSRTASAATVEVGQTWQRSVGKQRLRIVRVFRAGRGLIPSEPELEGQMVVTCVPRNGGRDVVLTFPELHDHFTLIEEAS